MRMSKKEQDAKKRIKNIKAEIDIINHINKFAVITHATAIDFRGRIYSTANISHQAGKAGKYFTNAAVSKPADFQEIAINVAAHMSYQNEAGEWVEMEKASRKEKEDFFNANIDIVTDTAADFNSHIDTIVHYDDATAFIKVATAYAESVKSGMDNVIIPFDGTISGIQHYAAITHSQDMAFYTNITKEQARQDAYIALRDAVREFGYNGDKVIMAAAQFIPRATVKGSLMTKPYGSGRDPAVKGIKANSQLMAFINTNHKDRAKEIIKALADTITSERDSFVGAASEAMRILQFVTENIHSNGAVAVVSHFGFKFHNDSFKIGSDGKRERNVSKQLSAIAPGFIHYSDSRHLQLVINRAAKAGIAITAIHDSYGVVSADAKELAIIIRQEFVKMYEGTNHIAQFIESNKANISDDVYKQAMADAIANIGTYDVREILENEHAFS